VTVLVFGVCTTASALSGFLYDGTDWTTLDFPGASDTQAKHIDGSNIVGWHDSTSSAPDPVPEPTTILLLGSGIVGLLGFRRK